MTFGLGSGLGIREAIWDTYEATTCCTFIPGCHLPPDRRVTAASNHIVMRVCVCVAGGGQRVAAV